MTQSRSSLILEKRVHGGATAPPTSPQYLSGLDLFHTHANFPLALVYPQGLDTERLARGLAAVLKRYPIVSGRYRKDARGHVYVDCNDAGVDFRVHQHPGKMPYGAHRPLGKDVHKMVRLVFPWAMVDKDVPCFQVNVHRYDDGGAVLCCYATHSMFDGASFWNFMLDWSRACRGEELATHTALDRSFMLAMRQPPPEEPSCELLARPGLFKLIGTFARLGLRAVWGLDNAMFRIPAQTLQAWKAQAAQELPTAGGVSTGSLVTTYIMKAISPVMPPKVERSVGLVLDLRYKRHMAIPREFFGNALCYAEARFTSEQLADNSLAVLANQCRPPTAQVNVASLKRMLATMEDYRQRRANWRLLFKPTVETLQAGLVLNNYIQFPIYDIDMGTGAPVWFEMPPATLRFLLIVPTPERDDGAIFLITATKAELKALRAQFAADGIDTSLAV